MKRIICAALAAALLAPFLWTAQARAEAGAAAAEHHSDMHGKMQERMKKKLELTDEQAGKLEAAMKTHKDALEPIGRELKEGFKKLAGQVKEKAKDDAIQATLDSLKTARKAMVDENAKFHDSLAAFLTPTQRAKMALSMARMMHGRRGGFGGRHERRHGGDEDRGESHDDK